MRTKAHSLALRTRRFCLDYGVNCRVPGGLARFMAGKATQNKSLRALSFFFIAYRKPPTEGFWSRKQAGHLQPRLLLAEKTVCEGTLEIRCRVKGNVFQRQERKWQEQHTNRVWGTLTGRRRRNQGRRKDGVFHFGSSGKTLDGGVQGQPKR